MFFKNNSNIYIPLFLSYLFFLAFSIYQINFENLWFDELMTLWITNPDLSNLDTFNKVIEYENTPPLYFYILKIFFKMFGYNYELLRIPNLIFHFFSVFVFFQIVRKISKNIIFIYLAMLLFSLNYFLISYIQEGRVYIFFCFTSLLFINVYLKLLENHNEITLFNITSFFIVSLVLLNTFIFSFILIGSTIFYEFFFKKKNTRYMIINSVLILSIITSIILNFEFYNSILQFETDTIKNPELNFYLFNFFFKQFFGSKIMGYLFFLSFIISVFILFKKREINKNLVFLILVIFFSYFLPIIYGFIFSPVLQDKYIIYIIPIILIFISLSISKMNNLKLQKYIFLFLLTISISNLTLKIIKNEIDKPEFIKVLKELDIQSKSNIYVASFMDHKNDLYNQIVNNYVFQIIKKHNLNLKLKDKNDKNFWIVCYDPSNSYEYCLNKNELSNNYSYEMRFYQTIAILKDNN